MTSRSVLCLSAALAACSPLGAQSANVFLPLRQLPTQYFVPSGDTLTLDLSELYAVYPSPGPVVTVEFTLPVFDGDPRSLPTAVSRDGSGNITSLLDSGLIESYQTYKTLEGGSIPHLYRPRKDTDPNADAFNLWSASDFQTQSFTIKIETHADEVPVSTGIFISQVLDGAYSGTILQEQSEVSEGNRNLIFGQYRVYDGGVFPDAVIEPIETRLGSAEFGRNPIAGSVFLNREFTISPFGPTSQLFRVALTDNTARFGSGFAGGYPVVGTISADDLAKIAMLDRVEPFKLANFLGGAAFANLPLFSPDYLRAENYPNLANVFLDPSEPRNTASTDGITYSVTLSSGNTFFDAGFEALPASLDGPSVTLKRKAPAAEQPIVRDLGVFTLSIKGRHEATGKEYSHSVTVFSAHEEILEFFPTALFTNINAYNVSWFGEFVPNRGELVIDSYLSDTPTSGSRPVIETLSAHLLHYELGEIHTVVARRSGFAAISSIWLHYPELGHAVAQREGVEFHPASWFWTSPGAYPNLYNPASGRWYRVIRDPNFTDSIEVEYSWIFEYPTAAKPGAFFYLGPRPARPETEESGS